VASVFFVCHSSLIIDLITEAASEKGALNKAGIDLFLCPVEFYSCSSGIYIKHIMSSKGMCFGI
jgi:hypothetical protein